MTTPVRTTSHVPWLLFIAGPILWFGHFMAVYLFAEAACTSALDTEMFGLGVIELVTLVLTAVAALVTLGVAVVAHRRWLASAPPSLFDTDEGGSTLVLAGALLGYVSVIAILFVGLPAAVLDPC